MHLTKLHLRRGKTIEPFKNDASDERPGRRTLDPAGRGSQSGAIAFPAAVQLIWHLNRWFPCLIYRVSIHRMRMFRSIRVEPVAV